MSDRAAGSRPAYLFDADDEERARLEAHEALWDDATFRRLDGVGVGAGWRCLEIGAGTGSVARWLVERVGRTGHVVATDVDTRWLAPAAGPTLEVRHHDVTDDPLEAGGYDLVHCRLVLEHLPPHEAVVARLAAALRPGGWLVVEDYDVRVMALSAPHHPAWAAVNAAMIAALQAQGVNPLTGADLVRLLTAAGLEEVDAEAFARALPIPALAAVFEPPLRRLAPLMLRRGLLTEADLLAVLEAFADGGDDPPTAYTPLLVSVAGRRPFTSPP
jgi:SAM-dependent methyltransferase